MIYSQIASRGVYQIASRGVYQIASRGVYQIASRGVYPLGVHRPAGCHCQNRPKLLVYLASRTETTGMNPVARISFPN